jgi:Raf kinase inhibitor-like YbhB/YbcL family protein
LRVTSLVVASGFALIITGVVSCRSPVVYGGGKATLHLTSAGLSLGKIEKQYTCDGAGMSPELVWSAPPPGTQSYALVVIDRDALLGSFVHWILYDLSPQMRELPEGFSKQRYLPDGVRQGQNSYNEIGYVTPCPPWGTHRYVFVLYALDTKLGLPAGATREQVEKAMNGHILAHGELVGLYRH